MLAVTLNPIPFTKSRIASAIRHIFHREPENEHELDVYMAFCSSLDEAVQRMLGSDEYAAGLKKAIEGPAQQNSAVDFTVVIQSHKERFLSPFDLAVSDKHLNVLLLGQCFFNDWLGMAGIKRLSVTFNQYIVSNVSDIPDELMQAANQYDFQVVHIPMAGAVRNSYLRAKPDDEQALHKEFEASKELIELFLNGMMKFNRKYGLETYVCGLMAPQTGLHGRFAPRYHLSNMVFFIEQLNHFMHDAVQGFKNAYYVDFESICSVHGKKFSRDDFVDVSNHGGQMTDGNAPLDATRLVPTPPITTLYTRDDYPFVHGAWREIEAMHRTLHGIDQVKMIVIDLDDTLWRGLVGEGEGNIDGWPSAFIEALHVVKHRGILLAIISKNDESMVLRNWARIVGSLISIDDFAIWRINYQPKAINMAEILATTNLLPRNVVFIDDNPVERASVKAAFPDIRLLGDLPLYFKRILLWSAETQVAKLSKESSNRTALMQAQVIREESRKGMSREAFLQNLELVIDLEVVRDENHRLFARAFELINKTNQFNTTGRRLTLPEGSKFFADGGIFFVFNVRDKHVPYGLVGVIMIIGNEIVQFVMSCRVANLEVEQGALAIVLRVLAREHETVTGYLIHTDANLLCRDVFAKAEFSQTEDGLWTRSLLDAPRQAPRHMTISFEGEVEDLPSPDVQAA